MICQNCQNQVHADCEDHRAGRKQRLYDSCTCQHKVVEAVEPATGPAGE